MNPDKQWIVVDTDTGLDDAHSLLYLLGQSDIEILGITTIFANCETRDSARNVATVLRTAGRDDVPIYLGAEEPLSGTANIGWFVHGRDGLGDRGLPREEPNLPTESAADFLVRTANEHPGKIDLHPLGPLTNIALALQQDPELLLKLRSVVLMGGAGPYAAPGQAVLTDANTANDREAAEIVFAAPNNNNVTMVGVNVTSTAILDEHVLSILQSRPGPVPQLAATLLDAYNDFYQHKWGRRVSAAHDGLASVILHRPEIVTSWLEGPVNFTISNGALATRVALTADGDPLAFGTPEGPLVRAVTGYDYPQFRRRFIHALAYFDH